MNILDPNKWSEQTSFLGFTIPRGIYYLFGVVVGLTILVWVTGFAFRAGTGTFSFHGYSKSFDSITRGQMGGGTGGNMVAPSAPPVMDGAYDAYYGESARGASSLPYPYPIPGGYASGDDAEEYEVKTYNASIETVDSERTCGEIAALKAKAEVIFTNANEEDDGCYFTFKTPKDKAAEILSMIEGYDPKTMQSQTETIKPRLDNITSEEEILRQRLASIDATLATAEETYDEMAALAASTRDAEALARMINGKLQFIQQMTSERLAINDALARLAQSKANESDRLKYAFFTIQVYERKVFDLERISDEWVHSVRQFIFEGNELLIGLSLGLIINLLAGLTFALYLLIILVVAKYGWRFVRDFWNRP